MSTASELDTIRARMVLEELARRQALVDLVQAKTQSPRRQVVFILVLLALSIIATWLPWDAWLGSHPQVMHQLVGFGVSIGVAATIGIITVAFRLSALVRLLDRSGLLSSFLDGASDAGKLTP